MVTKPASIVALSDTDETINILVYGDSGVGKTVLAGTAPNALIIGTEKGTISAKRQGSKADLWKCPSFTDVMAAYKWLRQNPTHGYEWVIMDSMTEMQLLMLRWILDTRMKENRAKRDIDIPQIQDHQKWQNMFKRYISQFNALPANMLWTATAARHEDPEGDDIILPNLLGKGYAIAQGACAAMAIVGYLSVKKGKEGKFRRLMCETDPPYFGKDRYDCLTPYVNNPTIPMIQEKIADSGTDNVTPIRRRRATRPVAK